ncbi:unnamed protein product [Effrenium voratum]|nr:unnamed protein product [Effrenium voratum]
MAGVPKLPSEHPDPICFGTEAGVLFPEHLCCDDAQFPGGFWRCWDGPFTYENCCQQSSPQCSEHLVSEVWKFLDPDAKTTYRDFWLSDAFYQISRVRNASLACKTAFVASRVLALTKLSWIEQWEVIFSPRRAVDHHNFQLRAIAEAMWALLEEIPLWEFLSAASAEFVLGRLYGHSKKFAYYLLSDGMPLLSGRLPVSDGGSSEFQELLKRRMNLKLPLPREEARAYLSSSWSLPFGRICALLVLAHEADAAAAQGRVEAAQEELRKWVDQNDYADLFFSHWPIFRLMLHLHYHLQGRRIVHKEVDVLVLSCAHLPLDGLNWTQPTLDPAGCIEDLHRRVLSGEFHHQRWVLLVNCLWTAQHAASIRDGLILAQDVDASMAIGFPTTRNGTWRWPVRQLSGDRDLRFTSYPTGYRGSSGACCIGDTTSGTRAYRFETFASLLSEVEPSGSMASLVLQLDVLGGGAATCMVPPLEEEDYLQATLPAAFVRRHNIESLEVFGELTCFPSANHSEPSRCVTADLTEVMQGLASYCAQSCALWVEAAVGVPLPVAGKVMAGTSGRVRLAGAGLSFQKICAELRMRGERRCDSKGVVCGRWSLGCLEVAIDPAEASAEDSAVVELWGVSVRTRLSEAKVSSGELAEVSVLCGATRRPEDCAKTLRRSTLPSGWILLISPFAWDPPTPATVLALREALQRHPNCLAVGLPTLSRDRQWRWPARSIRYGYYKLQYRPLPQHNCTVGEASSGTRLYRPGVLPALLQKAVSEDAGTLLVELDLLAKLGGVPPRAARGRGSSTPKGKILTCALDDYSREEDYTAHATLTEPFAKRFHLEVARFGHVQERALPPSTNNSWSYAHLLADQRIATSLLYRRRIEDNFVAIVQWWTSLDKRHFAAAKQGTLLTAMIRGGDVSMMPWDTDLELALYSTGPNPVLSWCDNILDFQERLQCVWQQLEDQLQLPVMAGPDLFFSQWLYEAHLTFAKLRVNVDHGFDVNFESYVPRPPIAVPMFGRAEVRVSWPLWEHLFFEVFQGSLEKKARKLKRVFRNVREADSHALVF